MRSLLALPLLLATFACSSVPDIQAETRPTKITLKDNRTGLNFFLVNESHTSRSEYYSQVRNSAELKVIPDLKMGALLLQLEDFAFFSVAEPAMRRTPSAKTTLMIQRGDENWSLSYRTADEASHIRLAERCNAAFFALYNSQVSLQLIENPDGKALFDNERRRVGGARGGNWR